MIDHLGAVADARDRLVRRARDVRLVAVPGLADDLRSIGEALGALELNDKLLARVILSKHYGYQLSTPEYQALATLAGEVSLTHFREHS